MPADWIGERPLYEVKSNLFKGLAHPVRIRVLEVLAGDQIGTVGQEQSAGLGEVSVATLLAETGLEASHLSQHLAVLRNNHLVLAERRGSQVFYRLAYAQVAELLVTARDLLGAVLQANQAALALAATSRAVAPAAAEPVDTDLRAW